MLPGYRIEPPSRSVSRGAKPLGAKFGCQHPAAERFKAPVLKFGLGRPGLCRDIPKRNEFLGFSRSRNVLHPVASRPVLPSSVANSVATVPDAFPALHHLSGRAAEIVETPPSPAAPEKLALGVADTESMSVGPDNRGPIRGASVMRCSSQVVNRY
jgi:hypothetical protein